MEENLSIILNDSPKLPDIPQPPDIEETSTVTIQELFPNYAENEEIVEQTKLRIRTLFSHIQDRGDLEEIWDKNDEMYRVKPDDAKDDKHRANESTGIFHVSVNQLVSMAFKTYTDNPENYSYGFTSIIDDEGANQIRARNAEIMTLLLHKSMRENEFKKNLKKLLYDIYKNGVAFAGVPWEKHVIDLIYRDKKNGERKSKAITKNNLPKLKHSPLDSVWLDENIDTIDAQPIICIRAPISWTELLADSKKNKIKLFEKEGNQSLHDKFEKYKDTVVSTQYGTPKSDRFDNADRTLQDRTGARYKHWLCWANLPIDKDKNKWENDGAEIRCRVRIIGDPENGDILEIRENVFPAGIPMLVGHQTQDDIGMYPISLGEKVKTYYDQICIAIDQLIDNRSKNNRKPIVCDPVRVNLDRYDFGHSGVITVDGDVRTALMELQISDMTGTIMNTINYYELKVKEIMNTTDAVLGMAMGGRTSASEYMGARAAATTPIFSDMASIEDDIIGGFMRKFSQYIHTFMTLDDIIEQIGPIGKEFQFDLNDIYTIDLRGVTEFINKTERIQGFMQLYNLTQDSGVKSKIVLRIAKTMGVENPQELVVIPAKDQAIKAALYENNEMLIFGKWDEPEPGELHEAHLPIHRQAEWNAQRDGNPNINFIRQHILMTEQLKKTETALAGISSLPSLNGPMANVPATPGQEAGQEISSQFGNINAGSPVPTEQPAIPVAG